MARVSTYLNFPRSTEEAFLFYKSIFGGEFTGGIQHFSEVPPQDGMPALKEADKNLVMHLVWATLLRTFLHFSRSSLSCFIRLFNFLESGSVRWQASRAFCFAMNRKRNRSFWKFFVWFVAASVLGSFEGGLENSGCVWPRARPRCLGFGDLLLVGLFGFS